MNENEPGEAIYIVKRGRVDIVKFGRLIRSIEKHGYFG